jgi:hypothetical protein
MLRHIPIYAIPRTSGLRWEYDTERLVSVHSLFDQNTGIELPKIDRSLVYLGGKHFCPFKDTDGYMVVGMLCRRLSWSDRLSAYCDRILLRIMPW